MSVSHTLTTQNPSHIRAISCAVSLLKTTNSYFFYQKKYAESFRDSTSYYISRTVWTCILEGMFDWWFNKAQQIP